MTGFEFHLTLRHVKKIHHLRRQIAAKRGNFSANPQPHATRNNSVVPARQNDPPGLVRQAGGRLGTPTPSLAFTVWGVLSRMMEEVAMARRCVLEAGIKAECPQQLTFFSMMKNSIVR